MTPNAIFIGGPTSSNKTRLANEIKAETSGMVVNADSMQVYDQLEILTNKPNLKQITKDNLKLFGFIEYPNICSVGLWNKKVKSMMIQTKSTPIFVGGTGLYFDSLVNELSSIPKIPKTIKNEVNELHLSHGNEFLYKKLSLLDSEFIQRTSSNDTQRIIRAMEVYYATGKSISYWQKQVTDKKNSFFNKYIYVILKTERESLYKRINERCTKMLKDGVLDEIKTFLKIKSKIDHPLHKAIGLRSLEKYLKGKISLEDSLEIFRRDTRRYAKRQITWFKNRAKNAKHLEFKEAKTYILDNI